MKCPVCYSESFKLRRSLRGYEYETCTTCGASHVEPFPSPEEALGWYRIDDYYKNEDKNVGYRDYFEQKEGLQKTFLFRNKFLYRKVGLDGKDILEIGSGPGFYPPTLDRFHPRAYLGLDLNPQAVAELTKRYPGRVGSIGDLKNGEKFDVIVFFDVLEHILDPNEFLNSVKKHLKNNGSVFFTTPSTSSWLAAVSGRRWVSYIVPQHVILYNRKSLVWLLKKHGFSAVKMGWDFQWITLRFLVEQVLRLFLPPGRAHALSRALKRIKWSLPVPNGMHLIVARADVRVER